MTRVSLFAFISELCPNRQVTGTGAGRAGSSGTRGGHAEAGTAEASSGREEAVAVAARVSLAVAAKASAENFPVALRVLPKRWRAHLTALYGFARLTDDIGDEPLPGMPRDAPQETITATRLKLLTSCKATWRGSTTTRRPSLTWTPSRHSSARSRTARSRPSRSTT